MKSAILHGHGTAICIEESGSIEPAEGQVCVSLKASSLNRRDYWITQGLYPGIVYPAVLGSDGAGVVTKVGSDVDESLIGAEVIINPGLNWGESEDSQSTDFEILGMPGRGTLATEIVVPAESVFDKPAHLTWGEAAALPLAGLTAFRAVVKQGDVQAADKVLVTGIGGGVATFALVFATAIGAQVLVTSSDDAKLEKAKQLGAVGGYNYTNDNWHKYLRSENGMPNLIIDGAGGENYAALLTIAAPGGRIVNYGSTAGAPSKLDLFKLFWKQLKLLGSTMGSPRDFSEMLGFVNTHELRPVVDSSFCLEEIAAAFDHMADSRQFGKIVIEMPDDDV